MCGDRGFVFRAPEMRMGKGACQRNQRWDEVFQGPSKCLRYCALGATEHPAKPTKPAALGQLRLQETEAPVRVDVRSEAPVGFCAAVEATRLEPRSHFRNWPSWIASVPMRGAKRTEPRWALRQKARARPEGAAIHQKDTIIGVFLLGANRSPTSAGSPEIKKPRRVSGAPGLSVRGLYVE